MGRISPSKALLNYEHGVETTETDVEKPIMLDFEKSPALFLSSDTRG